MSKYKHSRREIRMELAAQMEIHMELAAQMDSAGSIPAKHMHKQYYVGYMDALEFAYKLVEAEK